MLEKLISIFASLLEHYERRELLSPHLYDHARFLR